jgi:hypothetical protein
MKTKILVRKAKVNPDAEKKADPKRKAVKIVVKPPTKY